MDMWFNFFFCLSISHFLKDKCKIAKLLLKHLEKNQSSLFLLCVPRPSQFQTPCPTTCIAPLGGFIASRPCPTTSLSSSSLSSPS